MNNPRVVVIGSLGERLAAWWSSFLAKPERIETRRVVNVTADLMQLEPGEGPLTMLMRSPIDMNWTEDSLTPIRITGVCS